MFLELLDGPFWKKWDETPKATKVGPFPTFPTEIHATEEERAEMRAKARQRGKDCDKSLEDVRSVADILSAPIPKDANGRVVTDVCMFGLLKRPPDDAIELVDKLPLERWCRWCQSSVHALLITFGERAVPALVRLTVRQEEDVVPLLHCVSSPLAFAPLLQDALSNAERARVAARRHIRRFPAGTAKLALALAAGADPVAANIPPPLVDYRYQRLQPCAAIRAGMLVSLMARLGCEEHVLAAARELDLESVAKRWIEMPVILADETDPSNLKPPKTLVLEGKRLGADQKKDFFRLLARIDWSVGERDIVRLQKSLDEKSRKNIADLLARRWKRRTRDVWVPLAAIAMAPERAMELASPKAVAHRSHSYFQKAVERTAVEVIGHTLVCFPEHRDALLAALGALALDPVKVRRHMSETANEVLVTVAEALGLPAETLDDRTIPSLGLDANAAATLDWGGRPVEVRMTPALEIVFVVDGEKRVTQPSVRKGDDKRRVAKAKKEVERLRTEGRVLALGLGPRVTNWMREQQRWAMDDFTTNVLGHPILRAIARGFVWGTYDDGPFGGKLTGTFRVAEDGTLADENDGIAQPHGRVGLVHVAELEPELARRWGSVMADYELLPLVPQLADLRTLTAEQAASDVIERDVGDNWYSSVAPRGWAHSRQREANYGWERIVGRHRLTAAYFYARKVLTARARMLDDYEEKWLKWGDVDRVAAHEMLADIDEFGKRQARRR
jgi:hypothetical protein